MYSSIFILFEKKIIHNYKYSINEIKMTHIKKKIHVQRGERQTNNQKMAKILKGLKCYNMNSFRSCYVI